MTAIKQVAVTSARHAGNLARYLDDGRALARSSQHVAREGRWAEEMAATRAAYGHDVPSRQGARNTVMYHQVIAFNPDECSCNGGPMTPERCMEFARQWVEGRYPSHEAVWVLHSERCAADGSERFAVHVGINRTDLETGLRLNEGRAKEAKAARAAAMRDMDRRWGLAQMVPGQRNSRCHAMQPTRAEREMEARGAESDKSYVRSRVRERAREIAREEFSGNRMRELSRRLGRDGVSMSVSRDGRNLKFRRGRTVVNGNRLGRGFSPAGVAKGLGMEAARQAALRLEREAEREIGE